MAVTEVEAVGGARPDGDDGGPGERRRVGGGRWRRRLRIGAVLLVVAGVLAAGIGVLVYRTTYQPLGPGGFGYGQTGALRTITDGISDTTQIITGPPGSTGTFAFSIANNGNHPVTILGYDGAVPLTSQGPAFTGYPLALRWSAFRDPEQTMPVDTTFASARQFPAHLAAHRQLLIWIQVTRPRCPRGGSWGWSELPLRWSAMGVDHTYVATSDPSGFPFLPVQLCYPATALQHLVPRG